jgi:hypothetical protein
VTVERIMTDNGNAYRSHDFRNACEGGRETSGHLLSLGVGKQERVVRRRDACFCS